MIIEIIVSICIFLGGFFSLLGSIGVIRFPDVYGRLHAATKSATLGIIFIMVGAFVFFLYTKGIYNGKLLLTILFVFLTAPLAGHVISRAAYQKGVPLWEKSEQDDLQTALEEQHSDKQ